ncbi:MAG: peptidoglycan D,D-transpeptidase FtsI family protein [Minisyncoccota bacterium]
MHNDLFIRSKIKQKVIVPGITNIRMRFLFGSIIFTGVALGLRLYFIQVINHEKWTAIAANQHNASQELLADRGEIYMQDGGGRYPLAVNREYSLVYVVPKEVIDKDHVTLELARILGVDTDVILAKLNMSNDPFEIVKKRLTDDEVRQIKEAKLKGVAFLPEKYRYYPAGELASQVIGFSTLGERGNTGKYGLESSQNERLQGSIGAVTQEKDAAGRWIPLSDRRLSAPKNGESLILTLDRVIQYETEKILAESIKAYDADSAHAIVMNPHTGAILAMASQPQFDPNNYAQVEDYGVFLNPAISFSYEPGSIMKPITMAIGLEEKKVSPMSEYVDTGVVHEAGYAIRNAENKVYGKSTMTNVLEQSINTGVIFVEQQVGNALFKEYFERFGFGQNTDVALPAELPGNIRNLQNIRSNLSFYTASFGQGVSVTPLQMVTAYAVLANGGILYKPQIIDRVIHADGTEEKIQPEVIRRVLQKETSEQIGKMLRSVVVNGHGKRADVPGYLVGGKTGTAQIAKSDAKGYEDGMSIGSFVGYAPLNDPQFVVLVKLDNPKSVEWAESSAAPTFGKIMRFLLEYAKIKPTEEIVKP